MTKLCSFSREWKLTVCLEISQEIWVPRKQATLMGICKPTVDWILSHLKWRCPVCLASQLKPAAGVWLVGEARRTSEWKKKKKTTNSTKQAPVRDFTTERNNRNIERKFRNS